MSTSQNEQQGLPWSAIELGCWTMVVLAPLLSWVNGPAVSTDQAVVRGLVFGLALLGGVSIRLARRLGRQDRGTGKRQAW